ncbi:MAG: RNA polymerase sigma factor [Chloroflexi bacterium]|nr:RNA polymerase sigma factor [Chloroflexota bacterium]
MTGRPTERDEWLAILYRRHRGSVHGFLYALVGDRDTADRLTEETFLEAYRNVNSVGAELNPSAWLYRLAYRRAASLEPRWGRKRERQPITGEEAPAVVASLVALAQLPLPERAALVLREREGLSYEELSEIFGTSLGSIQARLLKARQLFRKAREQART